MTVAAVQIPESLQTLIDSRLDTIDRMLLGRLPRHERLEIVGEVESQIFELLQDRDGGGGGGELTREDVLAVLARLDPPEAYLPEEAGTPPSDAPRVRHSPSAIFPTRSLESRLGKLSGILGL